MKCSHCGNEIKEGEVYTSGGWMNFAKFHLACKALWDLIKVQKERGYSTPKFNDKKETT